MSQHQIRVWASINMQGALDHQIIDLVDELGMSEPEASSEIEAIQKGGEPSERTLQLLKETAIELIGFEWGYSILEHTQEVDV